MTTTNDNNGDETGNNSKKQKQKTQFVIDFYRSMITSGSVSTAKKGLSHAGKPTNKNLF